MPPADDTRLSEGGETRTLGIGGEMRWTKVRTMRPNQNSILGNLFDGNAVRADVYSAASCVKYCPELRTGNVSHRKYY